MSVFRFKRFEVVNDRSAMKVNTDGVLLGAAMTISSSDRKLLDIGTGTGTIALMAAQRLSDVTAESVIEAIDIDEASATEAAANFARLGYTMEESANMAETAIVYRNVADGLDTVEEATDSIISTMKAFGIESDNTMGIVDRFNVVGKDNCPSYIVICD